MSNRVSGILLEEIETGARTSPELPVFCLRLLQILKQECFRLGAPGYVIKQYAAHGLLPALEAVRQGRQFVSCDM